MIEDLADLARALNVYRAKHKIRVRDPNRPDQMRAIERIEWDDDRQCLVVILR